jgi:trehalose synthase
MAQKVSDYEEIVGSEVIEGLRGLAEGLQGLSLIHINATKKGGGVAELLRRLIPLFNDLEIKARWEVLEGTPLFFKTTKSFHNALQGREVEINNKMIEEYKRVNRKNADRINLEADVVVIHDPQPAALIEDRSPDRWIWRCHIDLSKPDQKTWEFLYSYVKRYDVAIFSNPEFIKYLPILIFIIPPSIDPLSPKNKKLSSHEIEKIYEDYQIPKDKPILLQVSRFDSFKDPLGVISAYKLVKRERDCRLVLAGGMASDDPEGAQMLRRVKDEAADDPDIHILPPPPKEQLSDLEVNALQGGADVIIQKSLREGFALTVTEALWKAKPVVASSVGGIKLQVIDGKTGLLASSIEETAFKIKYLLDNPDIASKLGEAGKEHVRRNFLITRHLRDYLRLISIIA